MKHAAMAVLLPVVLLVTLVLGGCEPAPGTPPIIEVTEDSEPTFDTTVGAQTYAENTAIAPLVLPMATGGDAPLMYSLTPTVPGLLFTPASRTLSGTPTARGVHSMTYRVVDSDGDAAALIFTLRISARNAPGVPASLRVSDSGLDHIEWSWDPVPGADGYDVLFYSRFTGVEEIIARTAEEVTYRRENLIAELKIWAATDASAQTAQSAFLRVRSAVGSGEDRLTSEWSRPIVGTIEPELPASIATEVFMSSCPTPDEVAAVDRELELSFIDDPTVGWPLACSEDAGSVDLTVTQMGAYQALRLMKVATFSEPLPWTQGTLWDWFVAAIDGIEYDSNAENSFCCRGRNIVVSNKLKFSTSGEMVEGTRWTYSFFYQKELSIAAVQMVQLFVHEARHAEGPPHTCGIGDDATFAEMGAWAYVYYTFLWFEQKFLPPDFFLASSLGQRWLTFGSLLATESAEGTVPDRGCCPPSENSRFCIAR